MQAIVRSSQELNKSRENTSSDNQTGLGFSLNGDDLKENMYTNFLFPSHFEGFLQSEAWSTFFSLRWYDLLVQTIQITNSKMAHFRQWSPVFEK